MVITRSLLALSLVVATILALVGGVAAQNALPDVDVVVVAEVLDSLSWLALHQEVLATPRDSSKPLRVSLPAGTGGNRWMRVDHPKFSVQIVSGSGAVKVGISGKIPGPDALGNLVEFEQAALQVQAGAVHNELTLVYGLVGVNGRLLELYLGRQ